MGSEIRCPDLPKLIDEKRMPYTAKYFRLFGFQHGMMSSWDVTKTYKDREDVYAACIEKGCTWQELLDFHGYDKDEWL